MPDPWNTFLASPFPKRLGMILDPANANLLRSRLGRAAFDDYLKLADVVDDDHLSAGPAPNLVFVPGVMGSLLASGGLGGVWWIDIRSRSHINDLRLAPGGLSDADARSDVRPFEVDMSYEGFFAAAFRTDQFRHASFPFDWRKPLSASTSQLRDKVLAISAGNGGKAVHLVAHSMGGLMVRTTMMRHPELWSKVGKVVFLGTPHYGSPAIGGYLKNHLWGFDLLTLLGRYLDRETLRSMWGVISLLPAPMSIYPGTRLGQLPKAGCNRPSEHPCANFDLYDADAWHLSIDGDNKARLQEVLDGAAGLHRDLFNWHMSLDQDTRDRMAVIAGVGYKTLFCLAYKNAFGFRWEHMDRITARGPGDVHREGDGRVPLASAELEFVGETRYVHAEHGRLATVPNVYQDVFLFLADREMKLPKSSQDALSLHLSMQSSESITPALAGPPLGNNGEDPGYLNFGTADESQLVGLENALTSEKLPEFTRLRLL
jgi:pimeloyl-ACP methyl ester carboxylesterase